MGELIAAAGLFIVLHLLVSGTGLRDILTTKIGEKPYLGLFALASLAAIVWLCRAYNHASVSLSNTVLFDAGNIVRFGLGLPLMLIVFVLVVPGVLRGNPTSQGQEFAQITGILRITRHPFLCGVALWAGFHLIATGTLAGIIFFATFLIVAVIGPRAIDAKVRRKRAQDWDRIAQETSILPFAAIAAGRNHFAAREYFDARFVAALIAFAGFAVGHVWLFSAPAVPPAWLQALTL